MNVSLELAQRDHWTDHRRCDPAFDRRCDLAFGCRCDPAVDCRCESASAGRCGPAARERAGVGGRQRQRRRRPRVRRRSLELQLRGRAAAQRVAERATNHLVDVGLVAEAHFRLRRVDVHIDRRRRHRDEQMHLGTALLDRRNAVGIDDRVRDRAVLDDPPVDEHVLRTARRPLFSQRRDVAHHLDVPGIAADLDEVFPLAVQLVEPVAQ